MSRPSSRNPSLLHTLALVVKAVPYGDADLIVTLFTQDLGLVSALARSARSQRRSSIAALEPMHTLRIALRDQPDRSLATVSSATIEQPRLRLTADLDRMQAAGTALRWVRRTTVARSPEPVLWAEITHLLDLLDAEKLSVSPRLLLVEAGLRMLVAIGWGLSLEACVVCGRPCEDNRAAYVDPSRGGLICRACGGAPTLLPGPVRQRIALVLQGQHALLEGDCDAALDLVDAAFLAHADVR